MTTATPAPATTCPPRPTRHSEPILHAVAKRLLPRILKWLDGDSKPDEVETDLFTALDNNHAGDGYALSKWLHEYAGWCPDSELVNILDSAQYYTYSAHKDAVIAWAHEHEIKPVLNVGDSVMPDDRVGIIKEIRTETAEYAVLMATLGSGSDSGVAGTLTAIVPFEAATAAVGVPVGMGEDQSSINNLLDKLQAAAPSAVKHGDKG